MSVALAREGELKTVDPGGHAASAALIDRPRLQPLLDLIPARRLTLVIAGAGYGKSTLVRSWGAGRDVAWVALRDDPRASGGLVAAILEAFARAGVDVTEQVERTLGSGATTDAGEDELARVETIAAALADALSQAAASEAILVLDDLHTLAASPSATALVGALVRQAPPFLHVVVISRSAPPFRIQRLRAHGELVELGPAELALDRDEIGRLLEAALGPVDDDLAASLTKRTGGWPATVRLITEALRAVPADERMASVEQLLKTGEGLFPYLAEEVFEAEPDEVRELVRTVAPLDSFDAGLCAVLGLAGADETLRELRSRGMFIAPAPGTSGRLTLHALIRDYATRRLPLDPTRLREVRSTAAHWLAAQGEIEAALRLAAAAADDAYARELLREHGPGLVRRGRVDAVIDTADYLGIATLEADLALLLGDAYAHRDDWQDASARYLGAAGDVGPGDPLPAAVAWRLGRLHFERGEFRLATDILERATFDGASALDRARLLAQRALGAWRADAPDAISLADDAVVAARLTGDLGVISLAETAASYATMQSDFATSSRHFFAALESADEAGDVNQQIRLRNAGDDIWQQGQHIEELSKVLPMAETSASTRWLSHLLYSRGACHLDMGSFEAAEDDLRRALDLGRRDAAHWGPLIFIGDLHRMRGDLGQATEAYRTLVGLDTEDNDVVAFSKLGLARVLIGSEPEEADRLATDGLALAMAHHRHDALIAAGWVALSLGRGSDAAAMAAEAIAMAAPGEGVGLDSTLGQGFALAAMANDDPTIRRTRLEEAAVAWRRLGNPAELAATELAIATLEPGAPGRAAQAQARAKLRAAGVRPSAAGAAGLLAQLPPERAPAVEVRTLGAFQVLRHGVPVTLAEWRSKKPRDVLKLLVAHRGAVSREVLMEALWPDEELEATSNRLSVSLSHLRAVLDPARGSAADSYLTSDPTAVRLNAEALVIDLEDFLAHAREGLELRRRGRADAALDRLLAAESAYGGDLFEEDTSADWAVAPREEARGVYLQVARAIAELMTARRDDEAAARYLMRIVARDPFDEPAHLQLVQVLGRGRHHGEARRAYQAYVARMAELEVEPAPYPVAI